MLPDTCGGDEFQCRGTGHCTRQSWKCDGDHDCGIGDPSDELGCGYTSCAPDRFM